MNRPKFSFAFASTIGKQCSIGRFQFVNLSSICSKQTFHSINLSNICFSIGNQIGSNVAMYVFEVEDGRLIIVVSSAAAQFDVPGSMKKQPQRWNSRLLVMGMCY